MLCLTQQETTWLVQTLMAWFPRVPGLVVGFIILLDIFLCFAVLLSVVRYHRLIRLR
ncbi:hypothetical protein BDP67DRAFT_518954 [Colletotrichum lupini]|nr:hypothetical protein BDP67DRAFT_518954 [Colletotrichum lupini]